MSGVKVSKEVFEAFKSTENGGWYFEDKEKYLGYMIGYKLDKSFGVKMKSLNDISLVTFLKALNDGYELELNPHEKVLKDYKKLKKALNEPKISELSTETISSCMEVIEITLNNLGIYIEGVNK